MPNRLSRETSPYLRQHAENPVDWYPWGEEALTRARAENKPILLSIGYSACHWCHVMAHESFEDPATAQLMNQLYVNIKVDREERPDLDQVYQTTHQWLSGRSGGWPLTVLMTPEHVPFFSGTYFPPEPRYGLPAFRELLERAEQIYRERPGGIAEQCNALRAALAQAAAAGGESAAPLDAKPIGAAVAALGRQLDRVNGGFGTQPKFPQPHLLAFYLRHQREPVLHTLRAMAAGGLYDQLGGGFSRYSVDAHWHIPHFEKMLYDNGALLALYADAYAVSREPSFARVVGQTIDWALREMRSAEGGFYAALDADSEGEEGKYYVWSRAEAQQLLTPDEYAVTAAHYGLAAAPNFEGHYHLRIAQPLDEVAAHLSVSLPAAEQRLASARAKLLTARERRVRPGLDDKILTSWNALMVRGLARAARVFDRADWLRIAQTAVDFIRTSLWRTEEGTQRLYATWQGGRARHDGYLDDYAFLLDALLELMQAQLRPVDLAFAQALARTLLEQFEDVQGGFYFTRHDHEALLYRSKPTEDHATPSGNGIAAYALQRLAGLTGETAYAAAAERTLRFCGELLQQAPQHFPSLLNTLEEFLTPPQLVVLRGPESGVREWQRALARDSLPHAMVIVVPNEMAIAGVELDQVEFDHAGQGGVPAPLAHLPRPDVAAYVCVGASCLPPITRLDALRASLA